MRSIGRNAIAVIGIGAGVAVGCSAGPSAGVDTTPSGPPAPMLFVLMGHSQAQGRATQAWIDEETYGDLTVPYPAVQTMQRNSPDTINPLVWYNEPTGDLQPRITLETGMFGPEVTMGRDLEAALEADVYIAKMTVSGSNFISMWQDHDYLLDEFLAFVANAVATFGITDLANNLCIVSVNGSAADDQPTTAVYRAAMDNFFGVTRAAFGDHWIVLDLTSERYDYHDGFIRAAQTAFVEDNPKSVLAYEDDLPWRSDVGEGEDSHWSSNSVAEVGKRFAAAFMELASS